MNNIIDRNVLLLQKLLPDIRQQSSNDIFIFQQDSASAHRARETVTLLSEDTADFVPPTRWPADSPDLNPVDYSIWTVECASGKSLSLKNSWCRRT